MHGSKYGNWALNKCDLIIAVGTRFDDRVTGKVSAFAPGAKVIHFDIDAAEIGKIRHAEIPVVGPLKLALARADARRQRARGRTARRPHGVACAARGVARALPVPLPQGARHPQAADGRRARCATSRPPATRTTIWTTGVGQHQMWAMQYLACDEAAHVHHLGRPRDDGLRPARPRSARRRRGPTRRVICIDGDGCFQMTCQELATAALERLPIVVVIVNNGWLGMVRQWQELFYAERYARDAPDASRCRTTPQLAEASAAPASWSTTRTSSSATLARRARPRPHGGRRRARRPRRELLPDGSRRAPPRST